ncbi:MAG: tyrosine-type recombinase/integrase [Planctomycetota bacterium]
MARPFLAASGNRRRVCFFDLDNRSRRRQIALGAMPKAEAEAIRAKIDKLRAARLADTTPPDSVGDWLREIPDAWHARLVEAGYVASRAARARRVPTLAELTDTFRAQAQWRRNTESTRVTYERSFRHLLARFGADRPIDTLTIADAKDFRPFLEAARPAGRGLAITTASATITQAKTLFELAVDQELLDRNVFAKLKTPQHKAEKPFISADVARVIMHELPNDEWRLLFALSRWGGLRIISEVALLTWGAVDFANRELRVTSPKTQRHPDGASRFVPIFDELLPLLQRRFDDAAEGELYVIPVARRGKTLARDTVRRAIKAAGHTRWPELFNSLRSTRETELCQMGVPLSEVAEVIGHSVRVAEKNYLQQMGRDRRAAMLTRASTRSLTEPSGNVLHAAEA